MPIDDQSTACNYAMMLRPQGWLPGPQHFCSTVHCALHNGAGVCLVEFELTSDGTEFSFITPSSIRRQLIQCLGPGTGLAQPHLQLRVLRFLIPLIRGR